jgi:hypothetical protein
MSRNILTCRILRAYHFCGANRHLVYLQHDPDVSICISAYYAVCHVNRYCLYLLGITADLDF